MTFATSIGILRILALIEGITYLSFGITVPLDRLYKIEQPNFWIGLIHGVLFVVYCIFVLIVSRKFNWTARTTVFAGLASLIPVGTFIADSKIFKPAQAQAEKHG
jgi:integral membrane protein